jgi:hypothetical protein
MPPKLKSRWVFPVNFRQEDQQVLEVLIRIAKEGETTLTDVVRTALNEFAAARNRGAGVTKMDEFLEVNQDSLIRDNPVYRELLTPDRLRGWQDTDLLLFSRAIRSRKFELEAELKKRGYHFQW